MRNIRGFISLAALLLFAGCSTGPTGIYPGPAWPPVIDSLVVPAGSPASGTAAEFSVSWSKGLGPFDITWTFNGGTDIDLIEVEVDERSHTAQVTLVNGGAETATFTGRVFVNDKGKIGAGRDFSFSVAPAP